MQRFYYVAGVTVGLLFLLQYCLLIRHKKRWRLPPEPRFAVPFLGHIPMLKEPLRTSLASLAVRHGPIVHLRIASRGAVAITSAELAKECFSSELDVALANRPHPPSLRELSFDYTVLTRANYGAHWRTTRRVAAVHLLSAHRVNLMSDSVIAREMRSTLRRLVRATTAAAAGAGAGGGGGAARVELKRRLFDLSHSVLMEMMARTRSTYSEEEDMSKEAREMKDITDEISPLIGVSNLWYNVPVLRWLDVHGAKRKLKRAVNRRNAFIYGLIEAERQRTLQLERKNGDSDADEKKSMIGLMISLQKTEPDVYTDTFIAALVDNLLGAGAETTSTTIEWAMALLLNHPDALKKAQDEIDAQVGDSCLVDKNHLPHLPYLQCVINETLRLYPAAPMLIPHEASTDCKIHGYDVLAGSMVLVNAYAIHRDPEIWEAPGEFRPERFEHGRAEGKFMIPFGMGRRKCPGENLAIRTMGPALGALLQCFDWSRVEDGEVDMAACSGSIMFKAVPLEALCKPRGNMTAVLGRD